MYIIYHLFRVFIIITQVEQKEREYKLVFHIKASRYIQTLFMLTINWHAIS